MSPKQPIESSVMCEKHRVSRDNMESNFTMPAQDVKIDEEEFEASICEMLICF